MIASSHLSPGRVSQCRRWRHLRHLNYTLKIVTTTTTSPHAPKSNNSCTKTDATFYPSQLSNNKNNSSPRSLSYKKRKKKTPKLSFNSPAQQYSTNYINSNTHIKISHCRTKSTQLNTESLLYIEA